MKTRHLIVTGIGISALMCGCSSNPRGTTQQARHQMEAAPVATSLTDADATRRMNAGPQSPDAIRNRIHSAGQSLADAVPPQGSDSDTGINWTNPDSKRLAQSAKQRRRPAISQAGEGADAEVEAGNETDPSTAANVATQVAHPRPSEEVSQAAQTPGPETASGRLNGNSGNTYSSLAGGVTATIETDPDPLGHRLADSMRDHPRDLAAHFDYELLRFVRDEQVPQLDTISTLPSEDRELLTALMDGLSNFRSGIRADKNLLLWQKVRPVIDLADRVRAQAELSIPTIAICSKVSGFGIYDPMSTTLRAGLDNSVVIYYQVENFCSRQDEKGFWRTKLNQEVVLYTETGFNAWHEKSDIPVDLSRNRRHDFFVAKKVTFPHTLGVGRYSLKVSVVDEQVKRIAENNATIELIAQ